MTNPYVRWEPSEALQQEHPAIFQEPNVARAMTHLVRSYLEMIYVALKGDVSEAVMEDYANRIYIALTPTAQVLKLCPPTTLAEWGKNMMRASTNQDNMFLPQHYVNQLPNWPTAAGIPTPADNQTSTCTSRRNEQSIP